MDSQEVARLAADICSAKQADDVLMLDLREHSGLADWFVLATASSTVHAQAVARAVVEGLLTRGVKLHHAEGETVAEWILLDYLTVVVHIFLSDIRQFYGLERLWGDVPAQSVRNSP